MNRSTPVTAPQPQLSPQSGARGVKGTRGKRRLEKDLGLTSLAAELTKRQIEGRRKLKAQQRGMPAPSGPFLRATKPALWEPPQRAKSWVWDARHARPELSRKEGEGERGSGAGCSPGRDCRSSRHPGWPCLRWASGPGTELAGQQTSPRGPVKSLFTEPRSSSQRQGLPRGSLGKSPPANAGDLGSGPGPGRSHMPQSSQAHAPQLPSLCSRAHELQPLSTHVTAPEARSP